MKITITLLLICNCLSAESQLQGISVNLYDKSPTGERILMDGTGILFNTMWSDSIDLDDAKKITNPLENIAVLRNNTILAIEKRATHDTIPITLWRMNHTIHEFEIVTRSVNNLFLEDMELHIMIPVVNDTLRYSFASGVADTINRFRLLFHHTLFINTPVTTSATNNQQIKLELFPNPATGDYVNLLMQAADAGKYHISIFGYHQQFTYQFTHLNNVAERIPTNLPPGNYFVLIDNKKGKRIVKQLMIR
ncbi:MAG: T9SS type A sorting domain-containing protein [Chitinophagaceae bacterium]|nr:T9SS type A sorting domain-containing protein [Chitinophagaceae bacterium]